MSFIVGRKFTVIIILRIQSGFQLSVESNPELLWLCFTTLCDWFKKTDANLLNQSDVKPNPIATHVFPRLAPVTCICFEFSLVHCVVYVFCDWSLLLLWFWFWFWFCDTQSKTALTIECCFLKYRG